MTKRSSSMVNSESRSVFQTVQQIAAGITVHFMNSHGIVRSQTYCLNFKVFIESTMYLWQLEITLTSEHDAYDPNVYGSMQFFGADKPEQAKDLEERIAELVAEALYEAIKRSKRKLEKEPNGQEDQIQ